MVGLPLSRGGLEENPNLSAIAVRCVLVEFKSEGILHPFQLPSVTLEPGKRFEQRLALEDAYQFEEPGNYRITFSTESRVQSGKPMPAR